MANYMKPTVSSRSRNQAKAEDRLKKSAPTTSRRNSTNRSVPKSSGGTPNYMRSTVSSRAKVERRISSPAPRRTTNRSSSSSTTLSSGLDSRSDLREDHRPKSKKPFFWAQGGSKDMLTQAIARNVIAISKQQHDPRRKQGPGVLLTPNETIGKQMVAHRADVIRSYEYTVGRAARDRGTYGGFHRNAKQTLVRLNTQLKATKGAKQRTAIYSDILHQRKEVKRLKGKVNEYSLEHGLYTDRLSAARRTEVSWPTHESWGNVVSEMATTPSKLLTLGHGTRNKGFVAEEFVGNRPDQFHTFDSIVDAQKSAGLPLDSVAKRLDACHATANPLKPGLASGLREFEKTKVVPLEDRRAFVQGSSSAQQFAQAYQDRGVQSPEVRGADTTMARYPNTRPIPVYRNEVELQTGGRASRSSHAQTHRPIFLTPPPSE